MNALQHVCQELNMTVLTHVVGAVDAPVSIEIYSVGYDNEESAGTRRCNITPWFISKHNLVDFCDRQHDQIIERGASER